MKAIFQLALFAGFFYSCEEIQLQQEINCRKFAFSIPQVKCLKNTAAIKYGKMPQRDWVFLEKIEMFEIVLRNISFFIRIFFRLKIVTTRNYMINFTLLNK